MSEEDSDRIDPNDEYPLRPPGKTLADYTPTILPLYHEPELEEPDEELRPRFQFTLAHMLWAMTILAAGLGLLRCIPVEYPKAFAAAAGIVLFLCLAALEIAKPQDRRIYIVWWVGFIFYILSGISAAFRG
jgi:hypothetical protein